MTNGIRNKRQQIAKKAIAYITDALIPGFDLWFLHWSIRIGGSVPEDNYPGVIHRVIGEEPD
ncbi:MAG: hypothetical protein JO235_20355 [Chroococcidiopsidaceae cyanobacterium CP_BM_RX_35]|nr:hypothetical protein [Chroococcidiopsidaceae cyanobacterium CP_BM_RX_35]